MIDSIYVKEDLPTWSEVYYEFYKNKTFSFDHEDDNQLNDIDKYWKIPRRKALLATVTNQFNKMLYEDGYSDKFMTFLNNNITYDAVSAMFTCELVYPEIKNIESYQTYMREYAMWSSKYLGTFVKNHPIKEVPPIYTLTMPTGNPNPFIDINDDVIRINVDDINGWMCVYPIIFLGDNKRYYSPTPFVPSQSVDWTKIIDWMMIPFKDYFENGVGWKDNDGNVIASTHAAHNCSGAGFDPAL